MNSLAEDTASVIAEVDRLEQSPPQVQGEVTIAFLKNFTVDPVEPFLKLSLFRAGLLPKIWFANLGALQGEVLDGNSRVRDARTDLIVIAYLADWQTGGIAIDASRIKADIGATVAALLRETRATIVVNTLLSPFYAAATTGAVCDGDPAQEVNAYLRGLASGNPARLVCIDFDRLLRRLGESAAIDYRLWLAALAPFKRPFLAMYAAEIARVARLQKGQSKKCLILDCDNTLWGGLVGEDGLGALALDANSYPGNAYYRFQQTIKALRARGVLLALCSKNDEEAVWQVFDRSRLPLGRDDFSAWRINWRPKVQNIVAIAQTLNIGLDSCVFVDDDPLECDAVRSFLPQVEVLQVPERVSQLADLLLRYGGFASLSVTAEDRQRTLYTKAESLRQQAAVEFESEDAYLASLDLRASIRRDALDEAPRVAQLTQRVNQFNLTTRRYNDADIVNDMRSPDSAVFTLSVTDRFGAYGLVGVLIARRLDARVGIDTLLLSCRALGRHVEDAFVERVLALLGREWRAEKFEAEHIATRKNAQVGDFWSRMGFTPTSREGGRTVYELARGQRVPPAPGYVTVTLT